MKFVKYLSVFVLLIGLGISAWFFYPQYQIHQMKKHAVATSKSDNQISYLNYYRTAKTSPIHHLALGDSIIRGVGAGKNENFISLFSSKLAEQTDKRIEFQNQGMNGITSGELNNLVQDGRFDKLIKDADIVTINVGGNDILRMANGQNFRTVFQSYDQLQTTFSNNLSDITAKITSLNPNATIVFLELYNPLPSDEQMYSLADKLLPKWNLNIYEVANKIPGRLSSKRPRLLTGIICRTFHLMASILIWLVIPPSPSK
ncbi:GDSL-type esterase/lipase family protein [Neobacillus sp. OS1-33]|uniref:GDSL-type esterase/lipase family protein n=1 Tax=Neobacillus sp. OS1-33 TaxID=3070683 RepID=UPI0027DFF34D|nr:GDSL-type esterase/lipase family protein [Neobacillus sp. OS1-33]WML26917.1 GDSL-type esterase/lipase family protein [Neobacillus sp. OS1-33]